MTEPDYKALTLGLDPHAHYIWLPGSNGKWGTTATSEVRLSGTLGMYFEVYQDDVASAWKRAYGYLTTRLWNEALDL